NRLGGLDEPGGGLGGSLGDGLGGGVHRVIIISPHVFPAAHRVADRDAPATVAAAAIPRGAAGVGAPRRNRRRDPPPPGRHRQRRDRFGEDHAAAEDLRDGWR